MKSLLIAVLAFISFGRSLECGDGITYSNEGQTKYDQRFVDYPKIASIPTYKDGIDELNKLIEERLKVKDEGKEIVFRLNYMFTVTCDGQIADFKTLGDSKLWDLTNIQEVIEGTIGKWIPAEKDGKPVNCIYFAKKTVVGNKY